MQRRPVDTELAARIAGPRHAITVVWGPRQVGKTTSAKAAVAESGMAAHYASVGAPATHSLGWVRRQWEIARASAALGRAVLALDGISHIPGWAEEIATLWAADTHAGRDLRVVVVGTQPPPGATPGAVPGAAARPPREAAGGSLLAPLHLGPWTYAECREAFGWELDAYLFCGGYPGGAPFVEAGAGADLDAWRAYITDEVIEATIARDIVGVTRVEKPALLRQLLALACERSGSVMSYTAMRDRLPEAGNTTTLAHYLALLGAAGLVAGLPKYTGGAARQRASSPKLAALAPALVAALSGRTLADVRRDPAFRARLVRTAIGAYLVARAPASGLEVTYWRQGERAVDFVLEEHGAGAEGRAAEGRASERRLLALELRSGAADGDEHAGLAAFRALYPHARPLVEGGGGVSLEQFLLGEAGV